MNLKSFFSSVAVLALATFAPCDFSPAAETSIRNLAPHWIWASNSQDLTGPWRFQKSFEVAGLVPAAKLKVLADFCRAVVEINGNSILTIEPHSPTVELDVTSHVRRGRNHLVIRADRPCGPSAVALSLTLEQAGDAPVEVVTDATWRRGTASGPPEKAADLGAVRPELWGIGRKSIAINPFENYEQWRTASGAAPSDSASFSTAPSFEIALVRQAAADEGSWVSMAFDPQGRLTVAREDQGLLRMTLAGGGGDVTKVETINEDLQECRGLLYAHDSLYANANNSKGLYRLRDTDGDDRFDEVRLLREFSGRLGHGRNDLALGRDGMIYSMHGDAVDLPSDNITDRTSPFREARRGKQTSEGYLVRTDRDGKKWEIVCSGLRNPFGIGVHPSSGDLFTYDADAEFDMGTPWYRPTRVVQLRSGADYGWRGVTGKWPPYYADHPDNALPALDIGRGSPTAVAFGAGPMFPHPYDKALFILDWSYGRMIAVHLAPRGAGYRAAAETFLQGRPMNLTDLAFAPDGSLYVITGGRKTQSALYRVTYSGRRPQEHVASEHERACQQHATKARHLRHQLEAYHGRDDAAAIDAAWPHLASADPAIRYAARIAIEHQAVGLWHSRAQDEGDITARLTALFALVESGQADAAVIIDLLANLEPTVLDLNHRLSLLHIYTLLLEQSPMPESKKRQIAAQVESLVKQLPSEWEVTGAGTTANLRYYLSRLLADSGSPVAVETVVGLLLPSPRQEDRLQALLALRNVRHGWTDESRRQYFAALADMSRFVSGEGMPKFQAHLRDDALATLSQAERMSLADLLDAKSDAAQEELPPARPVIQKWTMADLEPLVADASRRGDPQHGAAVFREAQCVRCHRVGARGPAVGPDLSYVGRRFSRHDMLESILAPSKVIADNYRSVQVITKDGRTLVGRVVVEGDFRSETLRIAVDPLRPAAIVEINKRELEEYGQSDISPMPEGLLDGFQAQEILDLLAYLQTPEVESIVPAPGNGQ